MASWSWLRHAPWGEIAKAAARVPAFVRDLRKDDDDEPAPARQPAADVPPDVAQLKFELELVKTNLERLRVHSESQAAALDQQARALSESFQSISSRLRTLTWLASAALIAAGIALAVALLR
ncbi:hypothetical protein [Elioraea sp.]|jgi:hypothetical protein|uniref:hypothetical protein n=1 Tax=Elioraea sp. TaxID=2185103 RepID=UPI0025BF2B08|nr:hypothetical protein [Elioraea sp.]